jgi:serine/threonine protein kinase
MPFLMTPALIDRAEYKTYFESNNSIPENIKFSAGDKFYLSSGPYECVKFLGEGGFGLVYEIKNESDNQNYALKILDLATKDPKDFDNYKRRFLQGFDIGRLNSSHLVSNYFKGELHGNPYIIMEFCENSNLRSRIGNNLDPSDFNQIGKGILKGLASLHENGIVHRDLKPENVLFDSNFQAKLSDYDISILVDQRQTIRNWMGQLRQVWGTLPYAPPEQLDVFNGFKSLTFAADMFSFGVTMYEVITNGCLPYGSYEEVKKDPEKYYERIKQGEPIPITTYTRKVEPAWVNIITKCISSKILNRYPNASVALKDLPDFEGTLIKPDKQDHLEGVWFLQIVNGSERGKIFNLSQIINIKGSNSVLLGFTESKEDNTNDIGISEYYSRYISRRQATLIFELGRWMIKDGQFESNENLWKFSKNGTFVNSYELQENEAMPLQDGDIIQIGHDTSLQIRLR